MYFVAIEMNLNGINVFQWHKITFNKYIYLRKCIYMYNIYTSISFYLSLSLSLHTHIYIHIYIYIYTMDKASSNQKTKNGKRNNYFRKVFVRGNCEGQF